MTTWTYVEWLEALDQFQRGDDRVLDTMATAAIAQVPEVLIPFGRRAISAFDARLQSVNAVRQATLGRQAATPDTLMAALRASGRGLEPLVRFARLPALPGDLAQHLHDTLERWCTESRKHLESALRHAHDQGATLRLVRLWQPLAPICPATTTTQAPPELSTAVRRHRPILGT